MKQNTALPLKLKKCSYSDSQFINIKGLYSQFIYQHFLVIIMHPSLINLPNILDTLILDAVPLIMLQICIVVLQI